MLPLRFLRRLLVLPIAAVLLHTAAPAQKLNGDSVWKVVAGFKGYDKKTLQAKRQKLSDIFGVALQGDAGIALRVTDSLAEACRLLGDSVAYYEALYRNKASIYEGVYNYVKTFDNLRHFADALQRIGEKNGYAFIDIGNQFTSLSLNDNAAQYYRKADEIFRETNNNAGRCTVFDNLGIIWRRKENADSSLYYLNRSLALRKDSLHDPYLEAYSYMVIGVTKKELGNEREGMAYIHRCEKIMSAPEFRQYKDFVTMRPFLVSCLGMLAQFYLEQQKPDSAKIYLDRSDLLTAEFGLEKHAIFAGLIRARLLMYEKKFSEALAPLLECEKQAARRNDGYLMVNIYKLIAEYYEKTGDYKKAMQYTTAFSKIQDSLGTVANDDQMLIVNNAMLQFDNDSKIEKQSHEIMHKNEQMAQEQREKYFLFGIVAAMLLVIAGGFYFFFQIRRKNKLIEQYNSELETANATKEKFLSVISHDLRNPFNTLIGMSNLLVANARNNNLSQVTSNAEAINESSRKAYVLLDNLMQWVSLQKEKLQVAKEKVSVHQLVDELMLLFRNQALAQSITIGKDIRVQELYTDRNLLMVILRNLLSNAVRHIPVGGTVTLRVAMQDGTAEIVVEDNGKGLSEDALQTLFKKKTGMAIANKGGGLGFELVQEFVEQLGGNIRAENMSGGGARFTVNLPGAVVAETGEEQSAAVEGIFSGLSQEEKKKLLPLVNEMKQHEIFDTTELRRLVDNLKDDGIAAIADWKQRMLQAIFHADAAKYDRLLQLVTN